MMCNKLYYIGCEIYFIINLFGHTNIDIYITTQI